MKIAGLQKFSLIDFPGVIACVLFTQGCPLRCHFCHNPQLVDPGKFTPCYTEEAIFQFLAQRRGQLDGVVISGGEPTIQPDLLPFMRKIKELGYRVKLDTSGLFPEVIEQVLSEQLCDYIAMDIKAPLHAYEHVTGQKVSEKTLQTSIRCIMTSTVVYEFRSTLTKELHSFDAIIQMASAIQGARSYVLQQYNDNATAILNQKMKLTAYDKEEIMMMLPEVRKYVREVSLR